MRFPACFCVLLGVAACGGQSVKILDDDAGQSDGGGRDATVDAGDAAKDASDEAASDCAELMRKIDTAREPLTRCCATCSSPQCNSMVDDLCCRASYTNQGATGNVADAFALLVREYKVKCPPVACPAVPCSNQPSLNCDPSNGPPGHCRPF